MMGIGAGLDLINCINSELTWKTVPKGSRSASRSSRKSVWKSLKPGGDMASSKIGEETSVANLEKLGVAAHLRRFGDKVEDVPIKKRRLMLRSQSPPRRTRSSLAKETEEFVDAHNSSGRRTSPKFRSKQQAIASDSTLAKIVSELNMKVQNDMDHDYVEDFSGIEILAAVACSTSVGDTYYHDEKVPAVDDLTVHGGFDSSNSTSEVPLKRSIDSIAAPKELAHGEQMDVVSPLMPSLHDLSPKKHEVTINSSAASRDDRSCWDLNTTMNEWEQTCDEQIIDSQNNVLNTNSCDNMHNKKLESSEGCEIQRDLGNSQPVTVGGVVLDEHKFEASSSFSESCIQRINTPTSAKNIMKKSKFTVVEGNKKAEIGNDIIKHEKGCYASGIQLGLTLCSKNVQVLKKDCVLPSVSIKSVGETESMFEETISYSSEDKVSIDNVTGVSHPLRVECKVPVNKSPQITALLEIQGGFTAHGANKTDGDYSAFRSCKIDLEFPLDDSYGSDVSQDNHGSVGGIDKEIKLQEGYDSQYEDGELRESDVYCWQGNETEDPEVEQVDYESDNGGTYDFDDVDNVESLTEKVEVSAECEKQRFYEPDPFYFQVDKTARDITFRHYLADRLATEVTDVRNRGRSIMTSNMQLSKHSAERRGGYDETKKLKHFTGGKHIKLSLWDHDGRGVSSSDATAEIDDGKLLVPRANPRELPSFASGFDRKDARITQRNRFTNPDELYSHSGRVTGPNKILRRGRSPFNMHDKSQGGGYWVDHSPDEWNSRRHYSHRNYGPYDPEHPYPDAKNVNFISKGPYRRSTRKSRSPADRGGMYTELAPMRGNNRGRSERYAEDFNRGPRRTRDGYHETILDDTEFSVRTPYYLARREEAFSPNRNNRGRAPQFSQPRRRSRSRSCSPSMWVLEKERNVGPPRHFRGSPGLRSGPRMDSRARYPFQKPNFDSDHDSGYMSPPRNHFSSRCIDDRDCAGKQFRGRKSPVRTFRQSQRFDSGTAPNQLKKDGYLRPMIRPERERRYEGNTEYRRKYGNRFDTRPGRTYSMDRFVRPVQYDAERGLELGSQDNKDDSVRDPDRRKKFVPGKFREEKSQLGNNRDEMQCLPTKTFETQEHNEEVAQ